MNVNEMGGNVNRIRRKINAYKVLAINVNGRGRLEDLDVDGSVPVKQILKKYEKGMSIGRVCLRTWTIGGLQLVVTIN